MQYYVGKGGQLSFVPFDDNIPVNHDKHPYKVVITEVTDENGDGRVDLADVEYLLKNRKNALTLLDGDGDFRSQECIGLLKQADIVVTNPPFSLFREYIAQLIEYDKAFIIIGNMNAVTYKEIFPLIAQNILWLGYNSGHFWFKVPDRVIFVGLQILTLKSVMKTWCFLEHTPLKNIRRMTITTLSM